MNGRQKIITAIAKGMSSSSDEASDANAKFVEQKRLLKSFQDTCKEKATIHGNSMRYYNKLNLSIIGTTIVLTTAAGTINISGLPGNTCDNGYNWLSFATGVTGLISATLISLHRLFGIAELNVKHLEYCREYSKLQTDISVQEAIDNTNDEIYTNLAEYIKSLNNKLGRLVDDSPFVPQFILRRFEREKKRALAQPAGEVPEEDGCTMSCFPVTIVQHPHSNASPTPTGA